MLRLLPAPVRGGLAFFVLVVNTLFWTIPLMVLTIPKLLIPIAPLRRIITDILIRFADGWVWVNNLTQRLINPIHWDVRGLEALERNNWYLVLSNHQSWTDILVLQRIFHRRIPMLKFFLKKELIWVPVIGLAWWALDFPFMKRYSKAFLKKHPHLKGKDIEITRKACEKFRTLPVSVMNFVEGTRFTTEKHQRQQSPYTHLLRPKSGGIAFVLTAMGDQMNQILDVTIAYPQGAKSFWAYLCGEVREIRVWVESRPISPELIGDYVNDTDFRTRFQAELNRFWTEKDQRLELMLQQ